MNILFIASEATPIVKVGGLADVVGALPKALSSLGDDVRLLLPLYGVIDRKKYSIVAGEKEFFVSWLGRDVRVVICRGLLPESQNTVYYLDCPEIFGVPGATNVYTQGEDSESFRLNMQRFVFFSMAATAAIKHLSWAPEVVHCHDWHAALVPLLLAVHEIQLPTVLTIHNLQTQGKWSAAELLSWLNLQPSIHPALSLRDRDGDINILQIGIHVSSTVNTVSPQYAKEILTPEYGEGLEKDLAQCQPLVQGILNGIDVGVFDPAHDRFLAVQYDFNSWAAGKQRNKTELQHHLGLTVDVHRPLFVSVGRLTPQKGFDLLAQVVPDIVSRGGQVALLGSGTAELEGLLQTLGDTHRSSVSVTIGFSVDVAQKMYAAGDYFLMPSRFEPCGLGQMIAMRYGALPIVRDTGGLHDSVIDQTRNPSDGTGFVFSRFALEDFREALHHALHLYQQPDIVSVVHRAMTKDFSWRASAIKYQELYLTLYAKKTSGKTS